VSTDPRPAHSPTSPQVEQSTNGLVLRASTGPLVDAFDALLVDLDGVVHLGDQPIPRAVDGLIAARTRGLKIAFVTNNASRTPNDVAESLGSYGLEVTAADVVTSSVVAARLLAQRLRSPTVRNMPRKPRRGRRARM